jgi:hypothetical protein
MAHKRHFSNKRQKPKSSAPAPPPVRYDVWEKKQPTTYGKPFILMEDEQKNTFV